MKSDTETASTYNTMYSGTLRYGHLINNIIIKWSSC